MESSGRIKGRAIYVEAPMLGGELWLVAEAGGQADNNMDNARLIAAAPELLEALKMLYAEDADYITRNNLGAMDNQCMRMARAAIAKAEGN